MFYIVKTARSTPRRIFRQLDSNGDKYLTTAFQHVFHTWYGKLHRYAHTLLKDPDEAADAVQAVFSRLWEKMGSVSDSGDLGPYLYRAVHNHCLNRIRKDGYGRQYADWLARQQAGTGSGDAGGKLDLAELSARIAEALDALPPQCRLIFSLSREQGKKYAEIAETLSLSVKTVETQMSRALRILREKLADYIALGGATLLYIDKLLS